MFLSNDCPQDGTTSLDLTVWQFVAGAFSTTLGNMFQVVCFCTVFRKSVIGNISIEIKQLLSRVVLDPFPGLVYLLRLDCGNHVFG